MADKPDHPQTRAAGGEQPEVKIEYFTRAIDGRNKVILDLEITIAWQSDKIKALEAKIQELQGIKKDDSGK